MRLKQQRNKKGLLAREVAAEIGMDEALYSKVENYRVLLVPADFKKVIAVLGCEATDIYDPAEIALIPDKQDGCGGARNQQPNFYGVTVKIGNEWRKVFTKEILHKCGYKNITDWVNTCARRLRDQYEIIINAEKKPPGLSNKHRRLGRRTYHMNPIPTKIITRPLINVKEDISHGNQKGSDESQTYKKGNS